MAKKTLKYPIKGAFADEKAVKAAYKALTDEEVFEWCKEADLTYKADPDHANITRMRACMAILYHHFPKAPSAAKKVSPYKDMTTEQLVKLAADNEVLFEVTDDSRILRMRAIMALRAAGATSPSPH